jgi:hypothetical protein
MRSRFLIPVVVEQGGGKKKNFKKADMGEQMTFYYNEEVGRLRPYRLITIVK